ncbi:MAG TPA: ABC transporter permease [Beijerinckiaceae bacterium]|nr:ABC transporter permease [Beijerinckiaceae bacterium]
MLSLVRRLTGLVPVLVAATLVVFLFLRLLPGDPARLIAGSEASAADVAALRADMGLDRPIWQQYGSFLMRAVQGDFGLSLRTRRPVVEEVRARLSSSLLLATAAAGWAVVAGVALGAWTVAHRGGRIDLAGRLVAVAGVAMPSFWLGLLLIDVFAVRLGWLPTGGGGSFSHLVLPAIALGTAMAATLARVTRAAMIEVLGEDFVRTARAKGLGEPIVLWRHVLRVALAPVVTLAGVQFGSLLGGAVVVETVFAWPGLGRLLAESVAMRDYPVIQAILLVYVLCFALVNLCVDLAYGMIDPKVRTS